jgi:hypothetical protein
MSRASPSKLCDKFHVIEHLETSPDGTWWYYRAGVAQLMMIQMLEPENFEQITSNISKSADWTASIHAEFISAVNNASANSSK